jgi:general secretion pathway protein H
MVVLLILTVTIGIIGINLGNRDLDQVRDEANRLAALLQTAHDETILQGRIMAVQLASDGYRFLSVDASGHLVAIERDDTFRARQLPDGMTLTAELDGAPVTGNSAGLLLEPSGQLPSFVLTFHLGDVRWQTRNDNGQIRSVNPEVAHAG